MSVSTERPSWTTHTSLGQDVLPPGGETITDARGRTILVAKARWLILLSIGIYGLCVGIFFSLSRYDFFLSRLQMLTLAVSLLGVISYNTLYHFHYDRIRSFPGIDYLQIFLDLVFVTLLVHFSGGLASWFWPTYLMVTLESSILLEKRNRVLLCGHLGTLLYGALLAVEYFEILPHVRMPFVAPALHHDIFFLLMIWLWVVFLNAAMAFVGPFLMTVIRRENAALRESEKRLIDFLDSAHDLIFSFSPEGKFLYVNQAWKKTLGYDLEQDPDLNIVDVMEGENRLKCLQEIKRAIEGEKLEAMEGFFLARDGSRIAVEGNLTGGLERGRKTAIWGICRDITERKQTQEQLYHLAHHDLLTGLPNRLLLLDRLQQAKALGRRLNRQVAILFLDLDRFKIINDTLGHAIGDKLLQEAAKRLTHCIREIDTVARMGGDEFIVLLGNLGGTEDVETVAGKILHELSRPMHIEGIELFVTTSIGISLYPRDDDDPLGLVKKADIAMYSAKAQGRNNFKFYSPAMDFDADKRLVMESSLRRALERKELQLYFQPRVDIASGRVTALEALMRWQHPELGLLFPGEFIPLAEETGLIISIGEWVLRQACEQNRQWQIQGLPKIPVAVNISGLQLQQKDFVPTVKRILKSSGLEPHYLELEVTETVLLQSPDLAAATLGELREAGVLLAIDQFGTSYSSLAHLKRFSVNCLKINKSFVRDINVNTTDAAIAGAIISMGASLNLEVIAEGVETEEQLSFLRENMCHSIQGFIFSKPVPAEEIRRLLQQRTPHWRPEREEGPALTLIKPS